MVEKVNFGFELDEKLNFREYLKDKFTVADKRIRMMKKLNCFLPHHLLNLKIFYNYCWDYQRVIKGKTIPRTGL